VRDAESSDEDDSTLRIAGRKELPCGTTGEKLPGARRGVPVDCDMVAAL
jgi:hypothetical protein